MLRRSSSPFSPPPFPPPLLLPLLPQFLFLSSSSIYQCNFLLTFFDRTARLCMYMYAHKCIWILTIQISKEDLVIRMLQEWLTRSRTSGIMRVGMREEVEEVSSRYVKHHGREEKAYSHSECKKWNIFAQRKQHFFNLIWAKKDTTRHFSHLYL